MEIRVCFLRPFAIFDNHTGVAYWVMYYSIIQLSFYVSLIHTFTLYQLRYLLAEMQVGKLGW